MILAAFLSLFVLTPPPSPLSTREGGQLVANENSPLLWRGAGGEVDTLVVVENIAITGNKRTRPYIINREMLLKPHDTLDIKTYRERFDQSKRNVLNTNLFVTVELTQSTENIEGQLPKKYINIAVKEQWYLLAFPVFSLADRNFNEWWYDRGRDPKRIIYGGYVSYHNFTGNNDKLRVLVELGFVPRFDISYSFPYIDKAQKTGVTAGFSYIQNKTMPYRTKGDKLVFMSSENVVRQRYTPYFTISHRPKFYGYHYLNYSYVNSTIGDTVARLNPNYFGNSRKSQHYSVLTYTHLFDRRDRTQYPLNGYFYGFQLSQSGIFSSDNVRQWESSLMGSRYWPLGGRWYSSVTAKVRISGPLQQPFLQSRGMGYEGNVVRGYELYVIDGQRIAFLKTNLRFEALKRTFKLKSPLKLEQFSTLPLAIYPNIYADLGYVENQFYKQNESTLANRPLIGVGAGLDIVTWYNFVMRLNYSVNHKGEARFYFSMGREY